jgi:hypothetical protein
MPTVATSAQWHPKLCGGGAGVRLAPGEREARVERGPTPTCDSNGSSRVAARAWSLGTLRDDTVITTDVDALIKDPRFGRDTRHSVPSRGGWAAMNGRRCHAKGRPAWQYGLVGGAGAVREPPTSRSRSRSRRACETLNPPSPRLGQIERAADLPCATLGDVPEPPGIATVTATSFGEGEHDGTRGTFDLIGGLGAVAAQLRNHGTQRANEIECDLIRDTRSTRACSAGEGVEVLSGRKRLLPTTSAAGRRP